MAEQKKPRKQHTIIAAEGGAVSHTVKPAPETGNAAGLRVGAAVLWVAAIAFEVLALLILNGVVTLTFIPTMAQLIICIVLDLICVVIGSMLWKKSNRIDPASEKNKVKFWLWNNMGVIAAVVAFVPFIILLLSNKNTDGKTKKIAAIVAIVALLIGGVASYDFDPVSLEEKEAAMSAYGDTMVYWAPFGKVYHTHEDCGSLNQSDTLTQGTVEQAIAANRTRLCKHCESRDEAEGTLPDLEDVVDDLTAQPAA